MSYKRNAEREVKEYSQYRTDANVDFVQSQIHRKNENTPYYSTGDIIQNSVNDLDHFPYDRFYRGIPESEHPVVFEREAGYRQRHDYSYTPCPHLPDDKPIHGCFQMPCSTVYPCYPKYLRKYADKQEMELLLNRKCITKFR